MRASFLLVCCLGTACLLACTATAVQWPDEAEAKRIVASVKAILPGWGIAKTARNTTPDGWHTFSPIGFLVQGERGNDTFSIWFLPPGWIGIRKAGHRVESNYWEGILLGEKHKTITVSTDSKMPDLVRKLNMSTSSIVNSGWFQVKQVFKGRFEEADATARRLIETHCQDAASRDEAAYSLVVLGVPAKSVFLRTAIEGSGDARESCISALGWLGGKDAAKTLCLVVTDPKATELCRKYAAQGLLQLADPDAGPALLKALGHATWSEERTVIAEAIRRIRYAPAGSRLLELFRTSDDAWCCRDYAEALAALRCEEAIPLIRRLLRQGKMGELDEEDVRHALLQLTAPWGKPGKQVRLLLQPPKNPVAGSLYWMTLYVENVGDKDLCILDFLTGTLTVNGKRMENHDLVGGWDGMATLSVNDVWPFTYDLTRDIRKPGKYTVQFETHGAVSNTIHFTVRPKP